MTSQNLAHSQQVNGQGDFPTSPMTPSQREWNETQRGAHISRPPAASFEVRR